jgi:hypothetical protein
MIFSKALKSFLSEFREVILNAAGLRLFKTRGHQASLNQAGLHRSATNAMDARQPLRFFAGCISSRARVAGLKRGHNSSSGASQR